MQRSSVAVPCSASHSPFLSVDDRLVKKQSVAERLSEEGRSNTAGAACVTMMSVKLVLMMEIVSVFVV